MRFCYLEVPFDIIILILKKTDVFGYGSFLRVSKTPRNYFYNNRKVYYELLYYTSRRLIRWDSGPRYLVLKYQSLDFYETWLRLGLRQENKVVPTSSIKNQPLKDRILAIKVKTDNIRLSEFANDDLDAYKKRKTFSFRFNIRDAVKHKSIKIMKYIASEVPLNNRGIETHIFGDPDFIPAIDILIEKYPRQVVDAYNTSVTCFRLTEWHPVVLEYLFEKKLVPKTPVHTGIVFRDADIEKVGISLEYLLQNKLIIVGKNINTIIDYFLDAKYLSFSLIRAFRSCFSNNDVNDNTPSVFDRNSCLNIRSLLLFGMHGIVAKTLTPGTDKSPLFEPVFELFMEYLSKEGDVEDFELYLLEKIHVDTFQLFEFIFKNIIYYQKADLVRYGQRIINILLSERYTVYLDSIFFIILSEHYRRPYIIDIILSSPELRTKLTTKNKYKNLQMETTSCRLMRMFHLCRYIHYGELWARNAGVNNIGDDKVGRIYIYQSYYTQLMASICFLIPKQRKKKLDMDSIFFDLEEEDIKDIREDIRNLIKEAYKCYRETKEQAVRKRYFSLATLRIELEKLKLIGRKYVEVRKQLTGK